MKLYYIYLYFTLRDVEELMLKAMDHPIPSQHPLKPFSGLKHKETVVQTLTKSTVSLGKLFLDLEDERVGTRLIDRETLSPEIATAIRGGGYNRFFRSFRRC